MKIYRVLTRKEYEYLKANNSLKKRISGVWDRTRFYDQSRAMDHYGKFFFFHIEDAIGYCSYMDNLGYKKDDVILQIEIDRTQALDNLSVGLYVYPDETKHKVETKEMLVREGNTQEMREVKYDLVNYNHNVPEVYLPIDLVDEKIKSGDYRIIDYDYRKDYETITGEGNREPHYVQLGNALDEIRLARKEIDAKYLTYNGKYKSHVMVRGKRRTIKHKFRYPYSEKDIEFIENDMTEYYQRLSHLEEDIKRVFRDFANEHEKYMMLAPVNEDSEPNL